MKAQSGFDGQWAMVTVRAVVNTVNVLQALGFMSRVRAGSMAISVPHHRCLWFATLATSVALLWSMGLAVRAGVG